MSTKANEHPLVPAFKARDELSAALSQGKWKRARSRAVRVTKIIKQMVYSRYQNYDGLFCVGEVAIYKAPEETQKAVRKMNEWIESAHASVPKKKKKRK